MNRALLAIIRKDSREVFGHWQVALPMVVIPLVFGIFLPMMILSLGDPADRDMEKLLHQLPAAMLLAFPGKEQLLFRAALDYMFPVFFLFIPVMAGSVLGAASFVGEKERGTMETLFYTPVTLPQLFLAKVMAVFIPAYGVTLLAFTAFGAVVNWKGYAVFGSLIFPTFKWLVIIGWLSPALALLAIAMMVIISARASTFQAAQQMSALVVLPVVGLIAAQTSGAIMLETSHLFWSGLGLLALAMLLLYLASRFIRYETLLS